MKKKVFIVTTGTPYSLKQNVPTYMQGIGDMIKRVGVKGVTFKRCYCCGPDKKAVCEFEAPDKDTLVKALDKIEMPADTIMESEKTVESK